MTIWNDTHIPLSYLITYRSYGTWLHGDERGSKDRLQNRYNTPKIAANSNWSKHNINQLKTEPVKLNAQQRTAAEEAIRGACHHRKWILQAVNIRTNHIHAVVSIGRAKPEKVLNDFKAYSTRKMRQYRCWDVASSPWADKGSKRLLWNEQSVGYACDYVNNGQGVDLPDFEDWSALKNPPADADGFDPEF